MDTTKITISIFLNVSKAFDTIDSSILLEKGKYSGFSDIPLKRFQSYLMSRSQYVGLNGSHSEVIELLTGLPRVSI